MLPQHAPTEPVSPTNLIPEHVTGEKVMLHPFVIGSPRQALFVVSIVPTFVVSQYTSHEPWQLLACSYVVMPTCATQALVPLQTICSPVLMNDAPFVLTQTYELCAHGSPVQHPVVVFDPIVLNAWRVPLGEHVAEHVPLKQFGVLPEHVFPQPPQLALSVSTFAHALPQYSWSSAQQWPLLHHSVSGAHAVLQSPQ